MPTTDTLVVVTGAFWNNACQLMSIVLGAPARRVPTAPVSVKASRQPSCRHVTPDASGVAATYMFCMSVKAREPATGHTTGIGDVVAFKSFTWSVPSTELPASDMDTTPLTESMAFDMAVVRLRVLENDTKST